MAENIRKNISKHLSSTCCQKLLDQTNQSATDAFKTASITVIQETAEATGDVIENKITDKITRVQKTSPHNNLEANEEKILREEYIPPELRQKIIDGLRLKEENY